MPAPTAETLPVLRRVNGRVRLAYRWADEVKDCLPALVNDLVHLQVSVIAATGGSKDFLKTAGTNIPIVFTVKFDPIAPGGVAGVAAPDGTPSVFMGIFSAEHWAKQLELLHRLLPKATLMAVLLNPDDHDVALLGKLLQVIANQLGFMLHVLHARSDGDTDTAFATVMERHVEALLIGPDNFLFSRSALIAALAPRHALPAIYQSRDFAIAGGLISYGPNPTESYRQAGVYAGRILSGEKPADMRWERGTRTETVISLRTARALGITVPGTLLTSATDVIGWAD
jgi:putative ABC transport system substrate-binding protein